MVKNSRGDLEHPALQIGARLNLTLASPTPYLKHVFPNGTTLFRLAHCQRFVQTEFAFDVATASRPSLTVKLLFRATYFRFGGDPLTSNSAPKYKLLTPQESTD